MNENPILITPAMIEAGFDVLRCKTFGENLRSVVEAIYLAMEIERQSPPLPAPAAIMPFILHSVSISCGTQGFPPLVPPAPVAKPPNADELARLRTELEQTRRLLRDALAREQALEARLPRLDRE